MVNFKSTFRSIKLLKCDAVMMLEIAQISNDTKKKSVENITTWELIEEEPRYEREKLCIYGRLAGFQIQTLQ